MKLFGLEFNIYFDWKSWAVGMGYYHGQYFEIQILCLDFTVEKCHKDRLAEVIIHGDQHTIEEESDVS